jgi:hypothetical protein
MKIKNAQIKKNALAATLLIFVGCSGVAGCDSLVRENSDNFETGNVSPDRFEADDQACQVSASDYVDSDLRGMSGTIYQINRSFNAVYSRCMTSRGYRPRPYIKNLLQY